MFAGSDEERLRGFHQLLSSDAEAILFSRGGHGVMRLLDRIDWSLLTTRPRWFIGYSDLTPLLLEITRRTGWMTAHGPMVAPDFGRGLDQREQEAIVHLLRGSYRERFGLQPVNPSNEQATAAGGDSEDEISGPLFGGCLAMICASLGTRFSPSELLDGSIIFLEDVGESAYKVDRMLCQLALCGLDRARAIVFGHCREQRSGGTAEQSADDHHCTESEEAQEEVLVDAAVLEVLAEQEHRLGVPIYHGIEAGHGTPNVALPIGAKAMIDRTESTLTLVAGG